MHQNLVLVPGLLCTEALWAAQVAGLADVADITVGDHTRHDSIGEIARAILAESPAQFALAGLSMGGYVALEIMRQAPERVTRLALLDTSARPDSPQQSKSRRDFIALARRGKFRGVTPQLIPNLVHADRVGDPVLTATILDMARQSGVETFIRQETAIIDRIDSRPFLGAIACPTLILCGREDKATPLELSEEMAALIPGARLEVIERCGHLAPLEQPDVTNDILRRWLISYV
ncbi:alpha/beta fold hydrolase [Govanella unica]|uniref:Alpha/beta hydrolase n=1 Tax=Govanella unica TaxID=2975056 RepID=A0A9X3Z735_9PROT|nr:alpha/beta fold hydrolase [Govania unica]MDA5193564.1 alpha/beta hydrolase [Govania unica]